MKPLNFHFQCTVYAKITLILFSISRQFLPRDQYDFISNLLPPSYLEVYGGNEIWLPILILIYFFLFILGLFIVLKLKKLGKYIVLSCFIFFWILSPLTGPSISNGVDFFLNYLNGGLDILLIYFMFFSDLKRKFK
jgi:hypothetical protein